MKKVLTRKFVAANAYIREGRSYISNNMSFYLRQLEKEKQIKSNISRRKEITKI